MNSMKAGGIVIFSKRSADVIRLGGLLLPVIFVLNAILIHTHILASPTYMGIFPTSLLMICWLVVGVYQFIVPSKGRLPNFLHLLFYHLFGSFYLLFVSGFSTPLISTWAILTLASYIYFKRDGIVANIATLLFIFLASLAFPSAHIDVALSVISVVSAIILALTTVAVWHANEIDNSELTKSREESILQRDRIMTIVNNISDAIFTTDSKGKIQLYNASALNLLDTNTDIRGKLLDELLELKDANRQEFRFEHEFKRTKSVINRDDLAAMITGEQLRLSVIYSPIRSANTVRSKDGYIIIMRDITKQKSLEDERDEFISVVSHELRTPIAITEGSLSNVQVMAGRDDMPKDTVLRNIKMAHEQVIFLARMVNDLSTLSRAERGVADDVEEIDVQELMHGIYHEYQPEAEAKGLQLNLDLDPNAKKVTASRLYLKELIQNFVTNAIKYTKEGSILVSVARKGNHLDFSVKDTGIGISKSDQARIFDKFYRSEDYRTRETGGTGLGLYVAGKLASKLGTTIELKSRLNHGSTFSFSVPETPTKS